MIDSDVRHPRRVSYNSRVYVWITRSQTQQFLTSIINIIRYQQLHVSALHVGHHQVVTLDQGSYAMLLGNIHGSRGVTMFSYI